MSLEGLRQRARWPRQTMSEVVAAVKMIRRAAAAALLGSCSSGTQNTSAMMNSEQERGEVCLPGRAGTRLCSHLRGRVMTDTA